MSKKDESQPISSANTCRGGGPEGGYKKPTHLPFDNFLFTVACFVDWENIRKIIFHNRKVLALPKTVRPSYMDPKILMHFFEAFLRPGERFYRIFIYLSEPLSQVKRGNRVYDLTHKKTYRSARSFIDKVSKLDLIAIRKGKLKVRDVVLDEAGNLKTIAPVQKQVDMLMGLDVAHVAYRRLTDRILMFSYDTDVVPALKTARINGLQVIVAECPDIRALDDDLKAHADFVRSVPFEKIFPQSSSTP